MLVHEGLVVFFAVWGIFFASKWLLYAYLFQDKLYLYVLRGIKECFEAEYRTHQEEMSRLKRLYQIERYAEQINFVRANDLLDQQQYLLEAFAMRDKWYCGELNRLESAGLRELLDMAECYHDLRKSLCLGQGNM